MNRKEKKTVHIYSPANMKRSLCNLKWKKFRTFVSYQQYHNLKWDWAWMYTHNFCKGCAKYKM